jgi:hypothetical protein
LARNGSGTFTTPNTFTPSTPILSSDVNENFTDVANELTNSLALDGQSTMTGQIKSASGTVAAPGWSFSADLDCGFYRIGANNLGLTLNGAKVVDYSTTGVAITGTFAASGNVAIKTDKFTVAAASGNTVVAGTLGVTGAATLSSTLSVSGTTTLQSAVQINSNVTVTGAVSGATAAGAMVASQAQMEAASATDVLASPGRLRNHPGVAKAWVKFNTAGTIAASHNVTSVTKNGTGDWTITFTTAFSSVNYSASMTMLASATTIRLLVPYVDAQATGTMTVKTVSSADGTASETGLASILVSADGDQ